MLIKCIWHIEITAVALWSLHFIFHNLFDPYPQASTSVLYLLLLFEYEEAFDMISCSQDFLMKYVSLCSPTKILLQDVKRQM